jgi:hypothetical protein
MNRDQKPAVAQRGRATDALATTLLLLALLPRPGHAQQRTTPALSGGAYKLDVELRMNAPDITRLSLGTLELDLGAPTRADFERGYREVVGPVAMVRANRPYRVEVSAQPHFSYHGDRTDPRKPASDVSWGTVAGISPHDLGAAGVLMSGTSAPAGGEPFPEQPVFFRIRWSFERDVPGRYSLDVRDTLSAP